MTKNLTVLEVALRDGSHAIQHQYTVEQVREITKGLDDANVPYIEVSHGDGIGGSSVQYGFSKVSDIELIKAAKEETTNSKISVLLLPGIGTVEDLKEAVRIMASLQTNITLSQEQIEDITVFLGSLSSDIPEDVKKSPFQ